MCQGVDENDCLTFIYLDSSPERLLQSRMVSAFTQKDVILTRDIQVRIAGQLDFSSYLALRQTSTEWRASCQDSVATTAQLQRKVPHHSVPAGGTPEASMRAYLSVPEAIQRGRAVVTPMPCQVDGAALRIVGEEVVVFGMRGDGLAVERITLNTQQGASEPLAASVVPPPRPDAVGGWMNARLSPGARYASATQASNVVLWNLASGLAQPGVYLELAVDYGGSGLQYSSAFSADGTQLAAVSTGGARACVEHAGRHACAPFLEPHVAQVC